MRQRYALVVLLSVLCLTGFRYVLGPKVRDVMFERDQSGDYLFQIELDKNAPYSVKQVNDKTVVLTFDSEVVWNADLVWADSSGQAPLKSYRAAPHPQKRNMWSVTLLFRRPFKLATHAVDQNFEGRYDEDTGRTEDVFFLNMYFREAEATPSGGQFGPLVNTHRKQQAYLQEATAPYVTNLTDQFDIVDGSFQVTLQMNFAVDFDVSIDASEARILAVGPSELGWVLPEEMEKHKVLSGYKVLESYEGDRDAIEFIFKGAVELLGAFPMGKTFVIRGRVKNYEVPEDVSPWDDTLPDWKRYQILPRLKEVMLTERTDMTWVDFCFTDEFDVKVVQQKNTGDVMVLLPLSVWEEVETERLPERTGLFVNYSLRHNKALKQTKMLMHVLKGTHVLAVQKHKIDGHHVTRVVLGHVEGQQTPNWLVDYGVDELPFEQEEKTALAARHLVYRGGVHDRATIGERFGFGAMVGYASGGIRQKGASEPLWQVDEGFLKFFVNVPIYANPEFAFLFGASYVHSLSGFQNTINLPLKELFYKDREHAMAWDSSLMAFVKVYIPVGGAGTVYARAGAGTGWFLDYWSVRTPVIAKTYPNKVYSFAGGVEVAMLDRATLLLELGYDMASGFESPYNPDQLFDWSALTMSLGISFCPRPMAGPAAAMAGTFVNDGWFVDGGVQVTSSTYRTAPGQRDPSHTLAFTEKFVMPSIMFGVGYLFFNDPLTLSAQIDFVGRDYRGDRVFYEYLSNTMMDISNRLEVDFVVKPGFMINHGVRTYILLGGLQRWMHQVTGPKVRAGVQMSEEQRRAQMEDGIGSYKLLGLALGVGFEMSATKNFFMGLSCSYQRFPDHVWQDHTEGTWKVGVHEQTLRLNFGYSL